MWFALRGGVSQPPPPEGGVSQPPPPPPEDWSSVRSELLRQRIADLGLRLEGTTIEPMVARLYDELAAKGLVFRPPVYLTDEWGCPDGVPRIGVPFYLADPRLARLEEDEMASVENERDIIRFLRHEAGHAFNYAYRLHERPDWQGAFGRFSRPYRERYHADPFSREYVRHILGWYAQKHPDEDFAETFAVWLTPSSDWRRAYAGWPALAKLEYVDRVMRELGDEPPPVPDATEDEMPVEALRYTLADHYQQQRERLPIDGSTTLFDDDLRDILAEQSEAPEAQTAADFLRRHRRELMRRIAHWTGEPPAAVGDLVDVLAERASALGLRAPGREATTLIELTAFGTAVMMRYRYSRTRGRRRRGRGEERG